MIYLQLLTKLSKLLIIELLTIVSYQYPWDTKSAHYEFPNKGLHILSIDPGQGLSLSLLSKIFYSHQEKFLLT